MARKNAQLADLRARLAKYEPTAGPDGDGGGDDA
jgi:hypothetical protein